MKKKNLIMIFIIFISAITIFSVGSYAYFSVIFQDERTDNNNGNTNLKTCSIAEATTITDIPDSIGSFSGSNIYPGHKEVASFKVSASGSIGSTSSFKIDYNVIENGLGYGNVKVSVYKSKEELKVTNNYFECEKKIENIESETRYYEECKEKSLGNLIEETILSGGSEEITIGNDTLLVREQNKEEIGYYYVVVEFLNKEENQNEFMNTHLNGKINIEATTENTLYTECILNGADPIIKDELIPVTIDSAGTVRKADITKEWYNYENQEWANAVITQKSYDALNKKGSVVGATKYEDYVNFDGINDYIDLGNENYDFSNQITFMARFRYLDFTNNGTIINNQESGGFDLRVNNGNLIAQFYIDGAYRILRYPIEKDKFYTAISTYDGTTMSLYVNGILVNSLNYSGMIAKSSMPILIGANPEAKGSPIAYANIDVKQVAVYNRAMSDEEIKNIGDNDIKIKNVDKLVTYVDFTDREYEDNEIILEDNIESYFVWIPKYRYHLWDLGNYDSLTELDETKVHTIPVIFGDYNTKDSVNGECTTPMESGATGNCKVGDYMTHPAFLSIPSTGFWAGKFETSKRNDKEDNSINPDGVQIKPNVTPWRNIQVANAFYTTYDYKRNLDSHMMKNTEWGAVAYLQHSEYGTHTSVRFNNNSDSLTGYSAVKEPTCGYIGSNQECNKYGNTSDITKPYNTEIGYLASTTGNISGIYDMSGGTWEYVMGVMTNKDAIPYSGKNSSNNSFFNGPYADGGILNNGLDFPNEKYYDKYLYSEKETDYKHRILGDATGETGAFYNQVYGNQTRKINSWYANNASFIFTPFVWIKRGSGKTDGLDCGVFSIGREYGQAIRTFRLVLTPTN